MPVRDILIVGAGPAGLATAIAAQRLGLDYQVVEKGSIADAIYRYPTHMSFFTTPDLLEIGGMPLVTPYEKPTRLEALRYYRKVAEACQLQIVLHEEVTAVTAVDTTDGPRFEVETRGRLGQIRVREARAVVLAMGYFDHPNRLEVPGEDLPHVSHYYHEAHPYYRQRVVVVGGKNSACETALELYRAGAHVTLVHRGETLGESVKYWVRPDMENRIRNGSIPAHFSTEVAEIRPTEVVVRRRGQVETETIPAEGVLLLTGYHADAGFLRRAGVEIDGVSLVPRHDAHTFETNVPNLFIAGGQVAGRRTGSVFIENGRFHGEQIAGVLAARLHGTA
ncbi:MAG: YpdA family putative bacillithiol disulfide reductase [Acidobacteriota bacterium]|nr:YpdA family putative bacillithiol disulfide reductase [Acidobacteriota bacterium]